MPFEELRWPARSPGLQLRTPGAPGQAWHLASPWPEPPSDVTSTRGTFLCCFVRLLRLAVNLSFPARQDSSYARRLQRLAVVPGHPLRGVGLQFPGMALQLRQIVERVGAAQLAGVDQRH